jgi:LacI family transcriptional regulator
MQDIADRCGVSKGTVSRALRNNSRIGKATIEAIRSVALEMGYDPATNHAAKRLAHYRSSTSPQNNAIGLMFHSQGLSNSEYFTRILRGVTDAAHEADCEVSTSDTGRILEMGSLSPSYRKGDIDGTLVILQNHASWPEIHDMLRHEFNFGDRPIVGLVEHLNGCSGAYPDNYTGGYAVMSHLLDLGHRRVMHYESAVPPDPTVPEVHNMKLLAYYSACYFRGLNPSEVLVPGCWEDNAARQDEYILDAMSRSAMSAIVAHHDRHAGMIYNTLIRAGYKVPEDVSIVGYDDTDELLNPERENILTTVRLPLYEVGYEGAKLLLRRVRGEEAENRDTVLPVELVARKSTAPPRRTKI